MASLKTSWLTIICWVLISIPTCLTRPYVFWGTTRQQGQTCPSGGTDLKRVWHSSNEAAEEAEAAEDAAEHQDEVKLQRVEESTPVEAAET